MFRLVDHISKKCNQDQKEFNAMIKYIKASNRKFHTSDCCFNLQYQTIKKLICGHQKTESLMCVFSF